MSSNRLVVLNNCVASEKHRLHKDLTSKYRKLFKMLDIMLICIILINFFSIALTNILVVKKESEVPLEERMIIGEANIIQAKVNNYPLYEEAVKLFLAFLLNFIYWILLIACYIYYRRTIYTNRQLTILIIIAVYFVSLIGLDFFNNFGYYLGRLFYYG